MTAARLAALVLGVVLLAGCGGSSSTTTLASSTNPKHSQLVKAARLDPCPPSQASSVSGGLPDLTLRCLGNGPDVHLAGLVGKPLVLNIWATWCGPCQAETRYLSQVYEELKPRVRFLGVDTEESSPDSALAFAPHVQPPMHYPSVIDNDKAVLLGLHGAIAVPSTVFVDADGKVVRQISAPYRNADALRADISRYLGVTG